MDQSFRPPAALAKRGKDRASRVELAAAAVRRWIAEQELAVGAQIPSERELADQLEVSRTVMREALSSLEALGLIERRAAIGRFVASGQPERSRALVTAWLHQHREELYEVDEIRALVERHVVQEMTALDCVRAAREGRGIVARQREALEHGGAVTAARLDGDFHRLLCDTTSNAMLRDLARSLIDHMPSAGLAVYSLPESAARSLEWHEAIVEALERGEPAAAARLDYAHTREASTHLRGETAESSGSPPER